MKVVTVFPITIPRSRTDHECDPNVPFAEGIDLDKQQDSEEVRIIRSSSDKRFQHIHVKESLTDALSAIKKYEETRKNKKNTKPVMILAVNPVSGKTNTYDRPVYRGCMY